MKPYLKVALILLVSSALMGQTRFPPQGGGVTTAGNNTWTGTNTFSSTTTFSAEALFSAGTASEPGLAWADDDDGFGSGWYRRTANSWTFSNGTSTVPVLELTGAGISLPTTAKIAFLTGAIGTGGSSEIGIRSSLTPDGLMFSVPSTSNLVHVSEYADRLYDFNNCSAGTSAQTNPTLCVHSSDQDTNEWAEINVDTAGGASLKSAQELIIQSGQIGTAGGKALTGGYATGS